MNLDMSDFTTLTNDQQKYSLLGLSEHIGSTNRAGHYTAHVNKNGDWYEFNDEKVKSVD